jgi:basic membrane lipoprotein Med (substrate-binding protein (PBP1-ABC) superfamily)
MRSWLALGAVLVLVGCSGGVKEGADSGVKDDGVFKVALLTPGPISDSGWNAMAYEGLTQIKEDLDCEVDNREATDAQIRDAMRSYAQKDYDLLIGHGFEYNEPGVEMAKLFPSTVFVSSSGGGTATNAGAFRFYLEQGFYLAGYMAGSMSKSGKIAAVGYNSIPSIKSTFRAFYAGATAANPDVQLIEPNMADDADLAQFKQATLAAIDAGADFVIHQANQNAQGVFDACKEKGVYAFGANLDQNKNASGIVIASAYIIAGPAYADLANKVKAGVYEGEITLKGMADGVIAYAINPKLAAQVPKELRDKIDALAQEIIAGSLVVPKDEF